MNGAASWIVSVSRSSRRFLDTSQQTPPLCVSTASPTNATSSHLKSQLLPTLPLSLSPLLLFPLPTSTSTLLPLPLPTPQHLQMPRLLRQRPLRLPRQPGRIFLPDAPLISTDSLSLTHTPFLSLSLTH